LISPDAAAITRDAPPPFYTAAAPPPPPFSRHFRCLHIFAISLPPFSSSFAVSAAAAAIVFALPQCAMPARHIMKPARYY